MDDRAERSVEIELKDAKRGNKDFTFRLVATVQEEGEVETMAVSSPPSRLVVAKCEKKPYKLNVKASIEQISIGEFWGCDAGSLFSKINDC